MAVAEWSLLLILLVAVTILPSSIGEELRRAKVIDVKGEPKSVVWVVQLSDLHVSVHHPERAYDLRRYVGPALATINPSLVLITGDLTGILSV